MTAAAQIRVLVLGAGRHGRRIADLLAAHPRFSPRLAAFDSDDLAEARRQGLDATVATHEVTRESLPQQIASVEAVIVTQSVFAPQDVARAAQAAGCLYLDILEDPRSAALLRDMASPQGPALAPGCGLAPGYVTALAAEVLATCGPLAELTVFVGVLPQLRTNRLGYADIWGVDGLIKEYTQPCAAIQDAREVLLAPLQSAEDVAISGQTYEAFTTAGSLDGLTTRFAGQVQGLVFKTLRYPGHLDYIRFLLEDLGLADRIYRLRSLLMTALAKTVQDRVVIGLRLVPEPGAVPEWQTCVMDARSDATGQMQSASGTATAAHVCAMLDILTGPGSRWTGWVAPGMVLPDALRQSAFFDLLPVQHRDRIRMNHDQTEPCATPDP